MKSRHLLVIQLGKVVLFIVAFCVVSYSLYSLSRIISTTAPDFSVYFQSAKNLFFRKNMYTDAALYTSFAYPPVTAFLYIPLTIFPYFVAQGIFSCLSYGLLYGVVFLCFRLFYKKIPVFGYMVAMILSLLSFPVKYTLGMGQINIIALFFLLCGMFIFLRKRLGVGALLVALSIVLKPQLAVILGVMLLCKKFGFFARISVWILGISALETVFSGTAPWMQYIAGKIPETMRFTSDIGIYYNQGFLALAGRIAQGNNMLLLYAGMSCIALFVFGVVAMKHLLSGKTNDEACIQYIICALPLILLIEPLSWQHHYVFLIPSFIWLSTQIKMNRLHIIGMVLVYLGVSINVQPYIYPNTNIFLLSHVGLATCMLYGTLIGILWKKHYDV